MADLGRKIAKIQFISRSKCGDDVGNCLFKVLAPLRPNCHHNASKRNSWHFSAKVWHLLPPLAPHSVLVTRKKLYGRSLCSNQMAVSFVFIFIIRLALMREILCISCRLVSLYWCSATLHIIVLVRRVALLFACVCLLGLLTAPCGKTTELSLQMLCTGTRNQPKMAGFFLRYRNKRPIWMKMIFFFARKMKVTKYLLPQR